MKGLRQQSKPNAQDERGGYGSSIRESYAAANKPRTTYAPAVDPKFQQPSGSQPGAGLPVLTSSVTRGIPATLQTAGASQSAAALGRPAPHGSGGRRSDQGGQEEFSHAFEYEAPSQPYPSGPSTLGRGSVGSLLSDEVRQLRDRVYAIEIALPGGQAASQAGKPGTLEVLRQDLDALGRETHELHGRVDRRAPAAVLKEVRRGLETLSHEVHGRMPSYRGVIGNIRGLAHQGTTYSEICSGKCTKMQTLPPALTRLTIVLTLAFLRPRRKTQRIVIPLKTPHVERRVNDVSRAMSGQDCKGSDEAVLQFVARYRANHL
ncbi:LOW QUALITY PROTEIN: Hypothetical protein PHPALM_24 [Phytophthora palmivora]|uniref:ATP-binding cassette (ABC) Superfamily n=1 Tax=Phytophthora palmivora TaxID=4796 RepID=A0A2P4YVV9_9STRA|nr:LOW QUALITY PROTEIN: Hypothetical protein PHPALM_24 [Phytophthora palmivora]